MDAPTSGVLKYLKFSIPTLQNDNVGPKMLLFNISDLYYRVATKTIQIPGLSKTCTTRKTHTHTNVGPNLGKHCLKLLEIVITIQKSVECIN